jgi:cation diffusion facilitator CzcD-associated flavoprotein CzcO
MTCRHFAGQPEILGYVNFLCDKFDLRRSIQFNTSVRSAHFDDRTRSWRVVDLDGNAYTSRWLLTAIGFLSAPTLPNIPGVEDFKGEAHHTSRWPKDGVTFHGKRVGVIGTGATGIQAIQEIAKDVGHLTVFQRTPNWAVPLHNKPIGKEEMQVIREDYPNLFDKCNRSFMNFLHMPVSSSRKQKS